LLVTSLFSAEYDMLGVASLFSTEYDMLGVLHSWQIQPGSKAAQ
jgi:hypothetical protein